jgi:hypothetical protein
MIFNRCTISPSFAFAFRYKAARSCNYPCSSLT